LFLISIKKEIISNYNKEVMGFEKIKRGETLLKGV